MNMITVPEDLGARYYRDLLSRQGQAFYDRIHAQILRGDHSGQTSFALTDADTAATDGFAAFKAIRDDHPEFFWLGFQSEFTRRGSSGTLKYPILYSSDHIRRIREQLRKSVYQIVRGTAYLSTLERETLVYERIARKLDYENHKDVRDHNIVGPILLSSGVCEGHNALLMLCFRRIGIPCIKVYGRTRTDGGHCWTIAWIDGTSVHCDVTWDGNEDGYVWFNYLNLSDREIAGDHFDFRGPRVPACTTDALSYYCSRGLGVGSFDGLRRRLRLDSAGGVNPLLIRFNYDPPSGDYLQEMQRALSAERILGHHTMYSRAGRRNVAVVTE